MPTSPFDRQVPEAPDFPALFPPCAASLEDDSEHAYEEPSAEELHRTNHMTALDASRLWRELHLAYHDTIMDIALFGETPYVPSDPNAGTYVIKRHWVVLWMLPTVTWSASEQWRNQFAHCFLNLADDLAAGIEPRPRNFAEAAALEVASTRVYGRRSRYAYDDDPYEEMPWDEHDNVPLAHQFDLATGLTYADRSPLRAPERAQTGDGQSEDGQSEDGGSQDAATAARVVAPERLDDWHSPSARPRRVEAFIHRRPLDDDGYADWSSLFPVCTCGDYDECSRCEGIQLTPRTALALRFASEIFYDYAREDVGRFEDDAVDGRFAVFSQYPPITWYQDGRWRSRAAEAYHDLGDDLIEGKWPLPQTHAEEMALHILLDEVDYITEVFEDSLDELPAHPDDYQTDRLSEVLFQDEDILMLFDMPHLASPDDPINASMYMGDMRPNSWFKPFGQFQPRERPEPDTSNVTPIRRP